MARFYGAIGFDKGEHEDLNNPGVYVSDGMEERYYYGTVLKHAREWRNGESVNDDLNVTNRISIVADDYTFRFCSGIRYVRWMGTCWKVTSFEVARPRMILTLGGVWNGEQARSSPGTCPICG